MGEKRRKIGTVETAGTVHPVGTLVSDEKIMAKDNRKYFQRKNFISLIILLIAGVVTFSPILENGFTNWDDQAQLLDNPLVREFSVRNLGKIFTTPVVSEYHPLVTAIFSLEYHLFGPNPLPFHLHSLVLHLLNGCLVFFLFSRLSDKFTVALVGSLLFLVHPFQVQAVAWISARKDLIFTLFFLLSLLSFFQYKDRKKMFYYFLSFLLFISAVLSKTLAVTFPVVIVLWLLVFHRPLRKKDWFSLIPYLAVSLAVGIVALAMQTVRGPGSAAHLDFLFENVILLFRNLNFYIVRILFPLKLSPIYLFPDQPTLRCVQVWPSVLLLLILAVWFRKWREERNNILWGSGFFLITIFMVLRFIPFAGIEVTANRFVYLPSIGLFYLAGCGFYDLSKKARGSKIVLPVLWGCAIMIIISLVSLTNSRCHIWRNSESLWTEAIRTQEESDLLYHMLADSRFRTGRYIETIELCDKAIALNPAMAYSYLLKSRAQSSLGRQVAAAETREQYNQVLLRLGIIE